MSTLFVADRSFNNFDLLARAFAVAVETEVGEGNRFVHMAAYNNKNLTDLLIQMADIANDYTPYYTVLVKNKHDDLPQEPTLVVAFKPLSYYPYKARVLDAKASRNTTLLEY